eukprot:TRINITY_DN732_c0_g1_i1.p1 TRINITY_DN732_c0_g1~~TRINITY_DN732_c0_g1_i1.p1  ORF type:complete len:352 (-),score=66.51 TRINITY_DN732_c0_g1_i1:229-1284(-)
MSTLAAARADNFYYPPEWTPDQGGLNKFQGQHPLRERARKLDQGILIIRFEMPFNVWCGGCEHMIAKGVRFNAEKKQIGNYLSSKIWSFKMKTPCCQTEIEIHTDPKAAEYIVVSGARQKVETYDAAEAGVAELPAEEEKEKLEDPFYRLEHGNVDKQKAKVAAPLILQLQAASDMKHSDPFNRNRALRADLRARKKRVAAEVEDAKRRGLGIRLLPVVQEDIETAANVKFVRKFDVNQRNKRAAINASSIFDPQGGGTPGRGRATPGETSGRDSSTAAKDPRDPRASKESVRSSGKVGSRLLELVAKRRRVDAEGARDLVSGRVKPLQKSGKKTGSGTGTLRSTLQVQRG